MIAAESTEPQSALRALWQPHSVAVVGASDDRAKWGNWLASGALEGRERRTVHLVNRHGSPVCGRSTVRSLRELDGPIDLVALAVPPEAVESTVDAALEIGAGAIVLITDGLDRLPGEGGLGAEVARRARSAGTRVIGPSSLGIVDTAGQVRLAWGVFPPGPVAVITQSGQVGSELAHLLGRHGSGVSRFASVGAQLDVTTEELLGNLVTDPASRAVIVYTEHLRDAGSFLAAAAALRAAGKPLIVLAVGASGAGSAAARSHTGALTADMDVLDAACRSVGAVRVAGPAQAAALAETLTRGSIPTGDRVAVVSDSGGQGALAADVASGLGLTMSPLSADGADRLRKVLPHVADPGNPVDLAGSGEQDLGVYVAVAETLAAEADVVVLTGYFGRFGQDSPSLVAAERAVARRLTDLATRVPIVVHSMADGGEVVDTLTDGGVPVFTDIEVALRAVADCAAWSRARPRPVPTEFPRPTGFARNTSYAMARAVLHGAGVAMVEAGIARSAAEAAALSRGWSGRTVLKASDLTHKTEAGGVVLGLRTEDEVAAAYRDLTERLDSTETVVERMDERDGVVELLVGVRWDPQFGAVVLVGVGGVTAELWRDIAVELAPVTSEEALRMLTRLRSHQLLTGWRGAVPVDLDAVADCVAAVSRIPAEDSGIVACEINPLRAGPDGVVAVDALVTRTDTTLEETP